MQKQSRWAIFAEEVGYRCFVVFARTALAMAIGLFWLLSKFERASRTKSAGSAAKSPEQKI